MLDAHFHLVHPDRRDGESEHILAEIEKHRITAIAVSNNLTSYVQTRLLTRGRRGVLAAVGFHPEEVAIWYDELDAVLAVMELEPLIGEIGLDEKGDPKQINALTAILEVCDGQKKVLSLHSREAVRPLLKMLRPYELPRVIWHWYLGDEAPLRQIVEMGHYLSVGPSINRKRSRLGRWIREWVPRECILTETDGPFGEKGKLRRDVLRGVLHTLSKAWGCSLEEAERQVGRNFDRLVADVPKIQEILWSDPAGQD
jgi:TatD DNase family protein